MSLNVNCLFYIKNWTKICMWQKNSTIFHIFGEILNFEGGF